MTNKKRNDNKEKISRRKFIQGGTILGATAGLSTLSCGKVTEEVVQAIGKKKFSEFPHEISSNFKRYDQKRWANFTTSPKLLSGLPGLYNNNDNNKPGYTYLDLALIRGAQCVDIDFGDNMISKDAPMYPWYIKPSPNKYQFTSKDDASKAIKRAAKFYGADLVGITPYDKKWVYDPMLDTATFSDVYDNDFPFKPKSVIVMVVEMDYEGMSTAPSSLENATTMKAYSKSAEVNYKLSTFIRNLGYKAFGAGSHVAESVPYAIAAGLGEQGRQGLLITYEYGPRVRLNKVFTEMELVYDKPIKFGANDFCKVCKKCAYSCPSQSISLEDEMTWGGSDIVANHAGVKKYYVNVETCFQYWNKVGNDCGVCIASCPFNKPDFWHHRITTALTATPLKPFLNEMDDLFGYGNVFHEQACIDFWGLENYTK